MFLLTEMSSAIDEMSSSRSACASPWPIGQDEDHQLSDQCETSAQPKEELQIVSSENMKPNKRPAKVYILNHKKLYNSEYHDGDYNDVENLLETFNTLESDIEIIDEPTKFIFDSLKMKLRTFDFGNYSAVVFIILSYSTRHNKISTNGFDYILNEDILFPMLENSMLKDKPKIICVQACNEVMRLGGSQNNDINAFGTPTEIFLCYSSYDGCISLRHPQGSPFIKALCEALKTMAMKQDITEIMNCVRVTVKEETGGKQVPCVTSTLTKKYIFGDYIRNK